MIKGSAKRDITGERFGLVYVAYIFMRPSGSGSRQVWAAHCRCDCGTETEVLVSSLIRGATRSCGNAKHKSYTSYSGEYNPLFTGYHDIRGHTWSGIHRRASIRGLSFHITIEEAWNLYEAQDRCCALTGLPIVFGGGKSSKSTTASLDRIDNDQGYSVGNVQWVDKRINIMRNVLPIADFVALCTAVTKHSTGD